MAEEILKEPPVTPEAPSLDDVEKPVIAPPTPDASTEQAVIPPAPLDKVEKAFSTAKPEASAPPAAPPLPADAFKPQGE